MSWPTVPLSRLLQASDSGVWGDEAPQTGISVLRSTNMSNDGTLDFTSLTFRDVPEAKQVAKALRQGDIVLENSGGGPKQPVGRVCYFDGHDIEHVVGNFCRRLRVIGDAVVPKYLFWRLHYGHLIGETLRYQTQTTGLSNLQFRAYVEQPIGLPARSEQRRIVELLDEADRLRRLRREADAKAARILPVLFLRMFGDPATNPKALSKKPLGSLIRVKSGDFLPAKDMAQDGTYPVYGGNGINGYHDSYMFDDRKIVLGRVGVYCGVVHFSEPRSWITDNALYIADKFEPLDDYYLVAALKQANLNQYAGRAGQPLISGSRIYPVEILFPPENMQARFAMAVEKLLSIDGIKTSATNRIDQLWATLMSRAFSGQLTAQWREAHMQELLAEMAQQARTLNLTMATELEKLS